LKKASVILRGVAGKIENKKAPQQIRSPQGIKMRFCILY